MPSWPEKRKIIGTSVTRIDGPLKVSGKAKYSYDRNLPGLLHAKILRSPHAHARIKSLDLSPAEALPGVVVSHMIKQSGAELHYIGDAIHWIRPAHPCLRVKSIWSAARSRCSSLSRRVQTTET